MTPKPAQSVKDIFAHHRKFTPFQKVLICSIFVGVLLCVFRSWWFLIASCTYTVAVYASVTVTKYIITCQVYFPSDTLLSCCENILEISKAIISGFQKKNFKSENKGTDEDKSANQEKYDLHLHEHETKEDKFFDTNDFAAFQTTMKHSHDRGLYCERTSVDENELSVEINSIIKLIQQDFIESWYKLFSREQSVLTESEIVFHHIVHALQGRLHRANTKKLFEFILLMFKDHVHYVKEAQGMFKVQSKSRRRKSSAKVLTQGESIHPSPSKLKVVFKSVDECYGSKVELHPAVTNTETEHAYQKSIIELLLVYLLREDMHDSAALVCALKEILTFNVLQKVMDLISTTTFLHERIIKITSDEEICAGVESIPSITVSETDNLTNNVQSILTQRKYSDSLSVNIPQKDSGSIDTTKQTDLTPEQKDENASQKDSKVAKWKEDTEIHTVSAGLCNECNRLCSVDKDRISPRPHTCSLGTTPTFFDINVDPDRLSLHSFASISSTSSKESAVFTVGEQEESGNSHATQDSPDQKQSSDGIDYKDQVRKKDSSPEKKAELSVDEPAGGKSLESPSHEENKSLTNLFPTLTLKFPFANPLPSLPNFRKPSFKGLSPTNETVSPSSEGTEQSPSDMKRSLSQGDVFPVSDDNTWPVNAPSVFQKIRITSTESAKEVGSFGEYTLYNVEVSLHILKHLIWIYYIYVS